MVIMLTKVIFIFLMIWGINFYEFEALENSTSESNEFCVNDLCSNKSQNNSETRSDFKEISNLNEKEIYFVATTDLSLNLSLDKSNKKIKEGLTFSVTTEVYNQATDNTELLSNITHIVNINELTTEDTLTSTEPSLTKIISTPPTKINISTTSKPLSEFYPFTNNKIERSRKICFCDIQMNWCDVNCCCDEDCSPSHFKVFTKCDDEYAIYDPKYCYKKNFIFGNNTSYQVIENSGGLFCIVRENLRFGLHYETKAVFTTMEVFNRNLPNNLYQFFKKYPEEPTHKNYLAGSPVWTVQNKELIPFKIPHSSVGLLCNSEINIKYLVDERKTCFYQQQFKKSCGGSKIGDVLHYLEETKIICNPTFLNTSKLLNSSEICLKNKCIEIISYICESEDNLPVCNEISKDAKDISQIRCWDTLRYIQYHIWHNGSEGIIKMEAYLWVKRDSKLTGEFLSQMLTEVQYTWVGLTKEVFRRSGNPGYLTGKPILAGKKIFNFVNGTLGKKEAIQLSFNPKNWLTILGSEKGICSSKERIPINFRENGQYMCSLRLSKNNFTNEKCIELQNNIFKLLIGNEIINETKENYFNKFVASFGNSKVEETADWVQILIDLFPISTSPVSFKSNYHHLMCKNVITDLYIDIIYSKIGSLLTPQSKILGVSFRFGKHRDLIYYCDSSGCENAALVQYFKLSSVIRFIDVTKPAVNAFAEPLSLEMKLPHDFFYPFFSRSVKSQFFNKFILILFQFLCFFNFTHKITNI